MKRLSLFLILGTAIVFFGCEKDNSTLPDSIQSDQETIDLKGENTTFKGRSDWVMTHDPGTVTVLPNGMMKVTGMIAEWYETTNPVNPYYTGTSWWYETWLIYPDGKKAKIWGKGEIILENNLGTWKTSWHGYMYAKDGYDLRDGLVPCTIDCLVLGQGKSGEVKGMVFRADYEMDFTGDMSTFHWKYTGSYH